MDGWMDESELARARRGRVDGLSPRLIFKVEVAVVGHGLWLCPA